MGQFKPMVKMMTTEPTVELKLKKGGTVKGHKNMKSGGCMKSGGKADASGHSYMNGGISAALAGAPMIASPRRRMASKVAKPSMAARRAAMMATGRKNGGAMEALKKHEEKPASKAHKGLKTGGVVMGQGGYKTGGVVKGQGGYKTGGVVLGQGGYKKGGSPKKMAVGGLGKVVSDRLKGNFGTGPSVPTGPRGKVEPKGLTSKAKMELSRPTITGPTGLTASGDNKYQKTQAINDLRTLQRTTTPATTPAFRDMTKVTDVSGDLTTPMKKGGSSKKYAEGGSVNDGGRPQKMPQGAKKPSSAVSIDKLSGTFKKGGTVASKRLQAVFKKENAPAMKAAKADSNLKYKKGGKVKKYADGGYSDAEVTFDESFMSPEERLQEIRRRRAMQRGAGQVSEIERESNEALLESLTSLPRKVKDMAKKAMRGSGAVTDTERTISRTVTPPAKRRGGKVCK